MGTRKHKELPTSVTEPNGCAATMRALEEIRPGEFVVYHRGRISADRALDTRRSRDIDKVGERAYLLASVQRQAHLVQYKISGGYAYVAIGRPPPLPPRFRR